MNGKSKIQNGISIVRYPDVELRFSGLLDEALAPSSHLVNIAMRTTLPVHVSQSTSYIFELRLFRFGVKECEN